MVYMFDRNSGGKRFQIEWLFESNLRSFGYSLGMCWDIADVTFSFKIKSDGRSLIKWTMLSMVSSIYHPLGFPPPFVLEGRRILQSHCNQNLPWDREVNNDARKSWNKSVTKLNHVDELYGRRCIRPDEFWKAADVNVHHCSNLSELGYVIAAISRW